MAQDNYFALVFGESFQHFAYTVVTLSFDHHCFRAVIGEVQYSKNVFVFAVTDRGRTFYFTEMIYAKIMCDPHGPGKKFSFFSITATPHGVDDADKNVLENILGQIFVFYQEQDWCIQLILMAEYQRFQCVEASILKKVDKFMVGFVDKSLHKTPTV